jgi:hypothetical protein
MTENGDRHSECFLGEGSILLFLGRCFSTIMWKTLWESGWKTWGKIKMKKVGLPLDIVVPYGYIII